MYHAPLRIAFKRIQADINRQTIDQRCLQLAVSAINCTVGPEDLRLGLLVLGAFVNPAGKTPAPSPMEIASLIDSVGDEMKKERSRTKNAFGPKHNGGQEEKDDLTALLNRPAGCMVQAF